MKEHANVAMSHPRCLRVAKATSGGNILGEASCEEERGFRIEGMAHGEGNAGGNGDADGKWMECRCRTLKPKGIVSGPFP